MAKLLSGYSQKYSNYLSESVVGPDGKKRTYITGPYQVFDEENQNGRIYPRSILLPEVERYNRDYVEKNRAFGELDHPDSPDVNGDRIAHRVVKLWVEGNVVYGKSLVLDTSLGREVKAMLEDGGVMGVSSRALGDVGYGNKVENLHLVCWDIVHEPSVASALMEQLSESREWKIADVVRKEALVREVVTAKSINKMDGERVIRAFRRYFGSMTK